MNKTSILFLLILLSNKALSQTIDYKTIRDTCTVVRSNMKDSSSLSNFQVFLQSIDTNNISINLHLYYLDLARFYTKSYSISTDTIFLREAIIAYNKSLMHKPNFPPSLLEIASIYSILKNCEMSKYYLRKYKSNTPRETWQNSKINKLTSACLRHKRNTLFFEYGGIGLFYSINYDRLLYPSRKIKIALRIGFEYHEFIKPRLLGNKRYIVLPTEYSLLLPLFKKSHFVECGVGIQYYNEFFYRLEHTDNGVLLNFRIGYRFQSPKIPIFFKTGFSPLFRLMNLTPLSTAVYYDKWFFPFGVAIGFSF